MNYQSRVTFANSNEFIASLENGDAKSHTLVIDNENLYFFVDSRYYSMLYLLHKNTFHFYGFKELKENFIWKHPLTQNMVNEIFAGDKPNHKYYYDAEINNYIYKDFDCGEPYPALIIKYSDDFNMEIQQDIINMSDSISLRLIVDNNRKSFISFLWNKNIGRIIHVDFSKLINGVSIPYRQMQ